MARFGIATGADLAAKDIHFLREHFGSFADYLYRAARGIDLRPVRAHRKRKSLGGERTFFEDISSGSAAHAKLDEIAAIVWDRIEHSETQGRTITLKLRYNDFRIVTRARTLDHPVEGQDEFTRTGHALLAELLPLKLPIRLMGLTLSSLDGSEQAEERKPDTAQLSLL